MARLNGHIITASSGTSSSLVEVKEDKGLTISLCLPSLNEEATIGKEIIILKSELKDRYPLIDEIAVIDSGSTDQTREIAAQFGADVYLAEDHLERVRQPAGQRGKPLEGVASAPGRHHLLRRFGH